MTASLRSGAREPRLNGLFSGKVAIVTGASRGIGAATARAFAAAGARVVLAARDAAALAGVAREVTAAGGEAIPVPTDVGDPDAVERLVNAAVEAFGRVDAAFNNAAGGGHPPTPLAEVAVEDFDGAFRVNLRGVFLCMKYEIPAMLAGGGGAIVNMASTAGVRGVPGLAAYGATKHGIVGLTRVAALDYAQQGVRVNAVAPGPILSERLAAIPEARREPIKRSVPMQRIGRPEEVAAAVVWLCSNQASFITGETVAVDGGRLAAGA
ncbi:MAG TPA: glucose 1-dehydrogenase [Dehalococcoidia bacterium]|nr:glucose 1-dehydrogenase [Dehalococcoidia bacterium]